MQEQFKQYNNLKDLVKPSQLKSCPRVRFKGQVISHKKLNVIEYLAQGLTNTEIAEILHLSPRTIENHLGGIRNILYKALGFRIRDRELVLFARDLIANFSEHAGAKDLVYQEQIGKSQFSHSIVHKQNFLKIGSRHQSR